MCDALLSCRSTALEDWIAGTGGKSTGQKRCALHQLKSTDSQKQKLVRWALRS